jgi:hypothetical protein
MTKEQLIESAAALPHCDEAAAAAFADKGDAMAAELTRRMEARPDTERLIGADNLPMMADNSRNMVRFLSSILAAPDPTVLTETALWVFRTYRMHGFQVAYWPANLDTFMEVMKEHLDEPTFEATRPLVNWLVVHIPAFTELSDQAIAEAWSPGETPGH